MPTVKTRKAPAGQAEPDRFVRLVKKIRERLEIERTRLCEEAAAYPTPIPRCDQQFNHLIEQRDRIFRELDRIDSIGANAAALEAYIGTSACIDDGTKRALRAELNSGD